MDYTKNFESQEEYFHPDGYKSVYKVLYFNCSVISPSELQNWLNKQYKDGLRLVGTMGDGYFIFTK